MQGFLGLSDAPGQWGAFIAKISSGSSLQGYYIGNGPITGYDANHNPIYSKAFFPFSTNQTNNGSGGGGSGSTPTPPIAISPAYIQARAVTMTHMPVTCDEILNSTDSATRNGTQFSIKVGSSTSDPLTQTDGEYVHFLVPPDTYTLIPQASTTESIRDCLTDKVGHHFGSFSVVMQASDSAQFDVAYGPIGPWFQTQGGDVYAANAISSGVPSTVTPRFFGLDNPVGTDWTSGVVTYGGALGSFDFNPEGGLGAAYVNNDHWLVNDKPNAKMSFYDYFYGRLGAPTTPDTLTTPLTQPASRTTPYYLTGDVTTSGDWSVGDGQNLVFIIDGNLNIAGNIRITGTGFVTFIVRNNITVDPSVGDAYNSTTPNVEGIYISGGTLNTGLSTVAGKERFVGKGIFIADNFTLGRSFESIGHNKDNAAQLFIYNPNLVWLMPDAMKEVGTTWQEVEP